MSERGEAGEAATPASRRTRRRQPLWVTLPVVAALVFAAVATVVTLVRTFQEDSPELVRREGPVAGLLGWLPATEANRRVVAVWAGEDAVDATPPPVLDVGLQDALGLEPSPPTLGRSGEWRQTFGWGAGDVTGWAVAGDQGAETTILAGRFDLSAVRDALEAAGYEPSAYQGGTIYVLHPEATPSPTIGGDNLAVANAVGILAGRLITAANPADVRAAIDAATGARPSLADDPGIQALLTAVGPSAGLAAIDAADLAAVCASGDPLARAPGSAPSGRYAGLSYGFAVPDDTRQSIVAATFADATEAEMFAPAWHAGWADAVISMGNVVAPVGTYGEVTSTGAIGSVLIARVTNGRTDGWAPLALRLASPVCAAVVDLTPVAPPPVATPAPSAAERRAATLALLPDAGPTGTLLFADLAATGDARGLTAPVATTGAVPPVETVTAWWGGLAPLPALAVLPADPSGVAQIPAVFGIRLDQLEIVAEARTTTPAETIAVWVGDWDPAAVGQALANAGYESLPLGEAIVFGVPASAELPAWAPSAWANVALWGDHLFLSPSGPALRAALAAATDGTAGETVDSARDSLLAVVPEATAGVVVGGEAARLDCAARGVTGQTPGWGGLAALWVASPDQERAALVALPTGGAAGTTGAELAEQVGRTRVAAPADLATPGAGLPLDRALGYTGTRAVERADGPVPIVADFVVPAGMAEAGGFFAAVDLGCAFVART